MGLFQSLRRDGGVSGEKEDVLNKNVIQTIMSIIDKIKKANLVGRGGGGYPTALKWEAVRNAAAKADKCFIVANCAEGEPGVKKDGYILANYADRVVDGLRLAFEFLKADKIYLYINHDYYEAYEKKIMTAVRKAGLAKKFVFFLKPYDAGYIAGEETALLNAIEGKRIEPRLRPPFPVEKGLWGFPTLVNNIETFYNISLADRGEFKDERFYSLGGQIKHKGVFRFPAAMTIAQILKATNNWPSFDFFVQVGGDASGEVLNMAQLNKPATGAASITVYDLAKHDSRKLLRSWCRFFSDQSCGQCVPCREGNLRLVELLKAEKIDWKTFDGLVTALESSSFCALGSALPVPIRSYFKNIKPQSRIK
jgi:NADH:ubiquinone oxidoreductase subunit F (NADH-binding)